MSAKPRRRADLRAYWSRRERDLMFYRSGHQGANANGHWLHSVLGGDVAKEFERRGFDLTTLRFSICRKPGLEGCPECEQHPHREGCSRAAAKLAKEGGG